jgi:hypothetical protein
MAERYWTCRQLKAEWPDSHAARVITARDGCNPKTDTKDCSLREWRKLMKQNGEEWWHKHLRAA